MPRNITRKIAVATAMASVAVAAYAMQPPDPTNEKSVTAWMKANLKDATPDPAVTWAALGADTAFLIMDGVVSPKDASGKAKVGLRIEMYAPTDGALSQLQLFEVDCGGQTVKQLSTAIYREHNLGGLINQQAATDPAGPVKDTPLEAAARRACAAVAPPAVVHSVDFRNTAAVSSWITRNTTANVSGLTWTEIAPLPDGVVFRSPIDKDKSESRTTVRVSVRKELFDAATLDGKPVMSSRVDYDLNCTRKEARRVTLYTYPNHNLTGAATQRNFTEQYVAVRTYNDLALFADDLCRDETQLRQNFKGA